MRLNIVVAGAIAAGAASILYARAQAEEFDRELGDWVVAGPPQECIDLRKVTATRAIGGTMLFKVRSSIKYRADSAGCPAAGVASSVVMDHDNVHLCKGDTVGLQDLENEIPEGSCQVGEFVPYKRQ